MAIVSNSITYLDKEVVLEGLFSFDDTITGRRPAVLICHAWAGRDNFVAEKAKKLAGLGYFAFALDMYGKGLLGTSHEENSRLMQPFLVDRAMLQQRITAALDAVVLMPWVDEDKIAAMGFCFGGLCVLDLARTGVDIQGAISFHGLLSPPGNTDGQRIKAKILALHGNDDPMVTPDQVQDFMEEMTDAGADWQLNSYGNTMHAFTNPKANDPGFGTMYQADADRRSFRAMQDFLEEIFA